jgi:hypothetical protein
MVTLERHTTVGGMGKVSRPWAKADLVDGLEFAEGGRLRITCHRDCSERHPRRWVFNVTQLTEAFLRAARADRGELVFGNDL